MKNTTQQASTKLQGGWLLLRSCTCIVLWMDFRSPDCNSLLGVCNISNFIKWLRTLQDSQQLMRPRMIASRKYNKFYENWTNCHLAFLNPTTIDEYRSWTNHCHRRAHSRHVCRQLRYQGFASEKDIGTHQHEADPGEKEYDCLTAKEPKPTVVRCLGLFQSGIECATSQPAPHDQNLIYCIFSYPSAKQNKENDENDVSVLSSLNVQKNQLTFAKT